MRRGPHEVLVGRPGGCCDHRIRQSVSRLHIVLTVSPHDLSGLAEARYPTLATALSAMYYGP